MEKYTTSQLMGLKVRIESAYYSELRLLQLKPVFEPKGPSIPLPQKLALMKIAIFYANNFTVQLSELFRFFRSDHVLKDLLKSTDSQRIEFRKQVRDVIAKSIEFDETTKKVMPFFANTKVSWSNEFKIIREYYESLFVKGISNGKEIFRADLRAIEGVVKLNPIK